MKTIIVALWAVATNALPGNVHNKRNIGISSGYGGAYGYTAAPNIINFNKSLYIDAAISSSYGGAYGYASIPSDIKYHNDFPSGLAISSGYGGDYGYTPTPHIVPGNKRPLTSTAISSSYERTPTDVSTRGGVSVNTDLKPQVAISSGYGGDYGYTPLGNVYSIDSKVTQTDRAVKLPFVGSNSNKGVYSDVLSQNVISVNGDFISGLSPSGYGGAYGYDSIQGPLNLNKLLPSTKVFSYRYGGAYGDSPTIDSVSNAVNLVKNTKMLHVMNTNKMVLLPRLMLSLLSGYSGYGNGINSYSGYSRYPHYSGYGFAYASGWL